MSELKEYCNIYLYIKKTNTPLFQLLEDTCTEHLFRFRYVTFLMPNSTLLNKMKKEKSSVAAKMIKSLLLKGVYKKSDELKGEIFAINGKVNDPSKLKVKPDPKFVQWEGFDNLSVLLYEDSDVPSVTDKPKDSKPKDNKKVIIDKKPEPKPEPKKVEKKVVKKTTSKTKK